MIRIINNTSVLTEFGYKKIQDLTINDKLLYSDSLCEITSIDKTIYSGDVYEICKRINFSNDPFYILPENKIAVLEGVTNHDKQKRLFNKYTMIPKFPNGIFINGNKSFDMIVNFGTNYKSDNQFDLTEVDTRLIGIIIGDGCVIQDKRCNSRRCQIVLGKPKNKTMDFIKSYLNERNIYYGIRNENNYDMIEFTCTNIKWLSCIKVDFSIGEHQFNTDPFQTKAIEDDFALKLDRDYFYDENKLKIIHDKFKNLPHDLLTQILRGLIETDGSRYYKRTQGRNRVKYSSSSLKLIYDIIYIAKKFNMVIGGGISAKKGSTSCIDYQIITRNYDNYAITIPLQFKELLKYFDYSDETLTNAHKFFNVFQDKSLERITKVESFHTKDFVYDITVKSKKYCHTLNSIIQ